MRDATQSRIGARAVAALVATSLLASCGGGGGGGGGSGAAGGTTTAGDTSSAVGVALDSPLAIRGEYVQSAQLAGVPVLLHATGDLSQLTGKALYFKVDAPIELFESGGVSTLDPPVAAAVNLRGRRLDMPGRYQGEIRVHACLEPSCATELAGSPLRVPYDVTVLSGIELDRQAFAVSLPFGQAPSPVSVTAELPKYLTTWGAARSTPYDPFGQSMLLVSNSSTSPSTGVVGLQLAPAPPGTYTETATVFTNIQGPDGVDRHYEKSITVTYTVNAEPAVSHVFWPSAGSFVRTQGDQLFQGSSRTLVTNTGVTAVWRGVEYLSHPLAADGHPQVNQWWIEFPTIGTSVCYNTVSTSDCLPPGTYEARVRYTLTKDGIDSDVHWPVTLQIVPR